MTRSPETPGTPADRTDERDEAGRDYCGVPAASSAFAVAKRVLAEPPPE